MKIWNRRGAGGFTEELPALLVVLVALSLFIASAAQARASYMSRRSAIADRERVESFASMVCADETLTWQGRLGMFDAACLADANASSGFQDRHPSVGFEYRVTVADDSGTARWSCNSSEPPLSGDKIRVSRPCNVVEPDGFVRTGIVYVEGWGMD